MNYQNHILPNGIRLLHLPEQSELCYVGFAIDAGTRDELEHEQGMAHFVEHMLFKGTEHRKSWHIIQRLEGIGGQLDAYTTKEETFIYATVPTRYAERALELLTDILFHSTFPDHELEKERDVILDEIQSYNDSPSELIYDEFEEMLFAHSTIGRNMLGKEAYLKNIDGEMMHAFTKRCYTTDRIVCFSSGALDFKKWQQRVEHYCNVPATVRSFERAPIAPYAPQQIKTNKDTFPTHCILGNRSYPLGHPERIPLVLLNTVLGGPYMSSRLNMSVRERHGLCYNIESGLTSYTDTGVWNIYFGCDPKYVQRCLKLIDKELDKLYREPLNSRSLEMVKRQVEGQLLIGNQNRENVLLASAKYYLHKNSFITDKEVLKAVHHTTAEQIQWLAQQLFNPEQRTQLIFE